MALHSALTGADLHELKGVSAATDNTVATAVTGAIVWRKVKDTSIDTTTIFNVNKAYLTANFVDLSTAEKFYIVVPFAGTLTKVQTVINTAITVADAIITVKNTAGSTAGTITVAFTAAAPGDIDSVTCSSNNTFTSGQTLSIETDGASTTASRCDITFTFTVTG